MLGPEDGLPPLEDIRVGLFYKHPRLTSAGIGLVNHVIARLDDAGTSGDPRREPGELRRCRRYSELSVHLSNQFSVYGFPLANAVN